MRGLLGLWGLRELRREGEEGDVPLCEGFGAWV